MDNSETPSLPLDLVPGQSNNTNEQIQGSISKETGCESEETKSRKTKHWKKLRKSYKVKKSACPSGQDYGHVEPESGEFPYKMAKTASSVNSGQKNTESLQDMGTFKRASGRSSVRVRMSLAGEEAIKDLYPKRKKPMIHHGSTHSQRSLKGGRKSATSSQKTAMYISSNIQQRECCMYARNWKLEWDICQCGRDVEWHHDKRLNVDLEARLTWRSKDHTRSVPCTCFGEIRFRGFGSQPRKCAPYMRVDSTIDMEKVWIVLTECWRLPVPKLLISVTGGAKRFHLQPRFKNIFKQGLIHAAVSTGAWIITGGSGAGVMEFVGEAVQDHLKVSGNLPESHCVALGIASWAGVANNIALDSEGSQGLFPANYCMEDISSIPKDRKCAALDHNHSHFVLVDDGTEGKFSPASGFRSRLQNYVSQKVETGVTESQSVNVPTVQIVVEGGIDTMRAVRESIRMCIPVVVIDGTGRTADLIASAFSLTRNVTDEDSTVYPEDFDEIMVRQAKQIFEKDFRKGVPAEKIEKNINDLLEFLKDCLAERKLLNIFKLDMADSEKDIDRAILYALLKANKSNTQSQLALALAWNRCDIAKQEIFTQDKGHIWPQKDLYNAMFMALVQNRADFVQLFLDNGVDLKRFLSIRTLWNLYSNCIADPASPEASILRYVISFLKQHMLSFLLKNETVDCDMFPDLLPCINKVICHLLQDPNYNFYSDESHVVEDETPTMTWKEKEKAGSALGEGGALLASALLSKLSNLAASEQEIELSKDMAKHSEECEHLAGSILSQCYSGDKQQTHLLLVRSLQHWGGVTLFHMAESYVRSEFARHSACQTKLSVLWKGRMALYTSDLRIFITTFLPFLIPFIKFEANDQDGEDDEEDLHDAENVTDNKEPPLPGGLTQNRNQVGPTELPDDDGDGLGFTPSVPRLGTSRMMAKLRKAKLLDFSADKVNIFFAFFYFYQAPVSKFFGGLIMYMTLLGLFSYIVLVELSPIEEQWPSKVEYITYVWVSTMIAEEIRQLCILHKSSILKTVRSWLRNMWNYFDAIMYFLFLLSIVLRHVLTGGDFVVARVIYSVTLAMFFLRLLQYFLALKALGPKVIMIRGMMNDLLFFFLILLLFVVSFGVIYHAIIFPNSPADLYVVRNVFHYAYFMMYGELFLDTMRGRDLDGCTYNETVWRENLSLRCPERNEIIPVLQAIYLVMTNILLVNLLIAMFSYTFQKVQDNSEQVWSYNRLSLVSEYVDRPAFVPPFIFFSHIARFVQWVHFRCTGKGRRTNPMRLHLTEEDQSRLTLFEKGAMEQHLSISKVQAKQTMTSQISTTSSRLKVVMEELVLMKEQLQQPQTDMGRISEPQGRQLLQRERDLLGRPPLTSLTAASRQASPPVDHSKDLQRLQVKVEVMGTQLSQLTEHVNHVGKLLEACLAFQQREAYTDTHPVVPVE